MKSACVYSTVAVMVVVSYIFLHETLPVKTQAIPSPTTQFPWMCSEGVRLRLHTHEHHSSISMDDVNVVLTEGLYAGYGSQEQDRVPFRPKHVNPLGFLKLFRSGPRLRMVAVSTPKTCKNAAF